MVKGHQIIISLHDLYSLDTSPAMPSIQYNARLLFSIICSVTLLLSYVQRAGLLRNTDTLETYSITMTTEGTSARLTCFRGRIK